MVTAGFSFINSIVVLVIVIRSFFSVFPPSKATRYPCMKSERFACKANESRVFLLFFRYTTMINYVCFGECHLKNCTTVLFDEL